MVISCGRRLGFIGCGRRLGFIGCGPRLRSVASHREVAVSVPFEAGSLRRCLVVSLSTSPMSSRRHLRCLSGVMAALP